MGSHPVCRVMNTGIFGHELRYADLASGFCMPSKTPGTGGRDNVRDHVILDHRL